MPLILVLAAFVSGGFAQTATSPMAARSSSPSSPNVLPQRPGRGVIFFPPFPPALDPRGPLSVRAPGLPSAPAELAEHAGEFFYPQLGTQLHEQTLSPKLRQQLSSYRADKQALQREIRNELARTRAADPATRRAALQALARRQAQALAALERTAEDLRRALIATERHWNSFRTWRLTDREEPAFSPLEIAQVMLAAAYYEPHLLVAQRGLLREIAHELTLAADSEDAAKAAQKYAFFSPSPARLVWPAELAPEVASKIADYETQKARLKKEIYDAIWRNDRHTPGFFNRHLEALAKQHAPKLQELERSAEDLRVALAEHPAPVVAAPRHPLPPVLADRIAALFRHRQALQLDASLRVEAIWARVREQGLPVRINFRFEPDGLKAIVVPTRRNAKHVAEHVQAISAELSEIADDYGRELADAVNTEDEIRREIGAVIGSTRPRDVDLAFIAAVRALEASRKADALAEYRAAVFEPGLSPEQRRVLFDGAIEAMDLPLPRGELQPQHRNPAW